MIEKEVVDKRVSWYEQSLKYKPKDFLPSPRDAFEWLFFHYIGLSAEDLPIIKESENEIIWLSMNRCPTLEACKELGLDTKEVCRGAYEKSTQALVSRLDPQLRFLRNYEEIRPDSEHCKEMIIRVDFEAMMKLAIEEAHVSKKEGNKGYGAVVVIGEDWKISSVNYTNQEPCVNISDTTLVIKKIRDIIQAYQQKLTEKNKPQLLGFFRRSTNSTFFGFHDNYFPSVSVNLRKPQDVIDKVVAESGQIVRDYSNIEIYLHTNFLAIAVLDYSASIDGNMVSSGQKIWSLISSDQINWKITTIHWQ